MLLPITGFRGYWLSKNGGVYVKRKAGWARVETSVVSGKHRVSLTTHQHSGRTSRTIERLLAEVWNLNQKDSGPMRDNDDDKPVTATQVPIGFMRDPSHGDIVPHDAEQHMIDRLEELIDQGLTNRIIGLTLHQEGHRSRGGRRIPLVWVDHLVARVHEARRLARESVAVDDDVEEAGP